jgi:hypothetical protein
MTSCRIYEVIKLCSGDYTKCEIFRKHQQESSKTTNRENNRGVQS